MRAYIKEIIIVIMGTRRGYCFYINAYIRRITFFRGIHLHKIISSGVTLYIIIYTICKK